MRIETLEEGDEKTEKNTVAITIALVLYLLDLYEHLPPQTRNSFILVVIQFTRD